MGRKEPPGRISLCSSSPMTSRGESSRKQAVVVGSGHAGLTAAAFLGRRGYNVTVLEQFGTVGGVTATVEQDGFHWDLGPMMAEGFSRGENSWALLEDLGLWPRLGEFPRLCRSIVFPDFCLERPATYGGPMWRRDKLKHLFPEDAAGIDAYYVVFERMMNLLNLQNRLERTDGWIPRLILKAEMAIRFLPLFRYRNMSVTQFLDHFFTNKKLKAVFSVILGDLVLLPSQCPGLFILLLNAETAFDDRIPYEGGRYGGSMAYPLRGWGVVSQALTALIEEEGGTVRTNAKVTKIHTKDPDGTSVTQVELENGEVLGGDVFFFSGGATETFGRLLDDRGRRALPPSFSRRLDNLGFMESVFMVHVGVDLDVPSLLREAIVYVYDIYDTEGAVAQCRAGQWMGEAGYVIFVTSWDRPDMAPEGQHAVTVYTIAANTLATGTYEERKEEIADVLLSRAERQLPGLCAHIKTKIIMTPDDFRYRTNLFVNNSFGGAQPLVGKELGLPYRSPLSNLWFIGAQSESAGGVGNVMRGAWKAVRMMAGESV